MRRRYDIACRTDTLVGQRVYPVTLGWRGDRPTDVALLVHISELTLAERWFPCWLLAAGVEGLTVDGDVQVRPGVGDDAGFVVVKPAATAPVMLLPEEPVGAFLAEVDGWARQVAAIRGAS